MARIGVCGLAFGIGREIRSNRLIGRIVSEKALEVQAEAIFIQPDIPVRMGIARVFVMDEDPAKPSPTLRVVRWVVDEALSGFDKLYLVAGKPHLRRALRDMNYAVWERGVDIQVIPCSQEVGLYPESIWFCENPQLRTCSREAWRKREGRIERLPMLIYRFVAS